MPTWEGPGINNYYELPFGSRMYRCGMTCWDYYKSGREEDVLEKSVWGFARLENS